MTAASAEMLGNGITTSVEMYFHPERIAAAVGTTGARAVIPAPLVPLPGMGPLDEQLQAAVDRAAAAPADGSVEYGIGPHAAYTVPLPVLWDAARAARSTPPLHLHVAETVVEDAACAPSTASRRLPCWRRTTSWAGGVLAAHCVHLDDADLALWRQHDVAVAHCPASNAKLASGIAPLRAMLDRGIRVGMGTDGPASNDGLDLFADLRPRHPMARLAGRSADASAAEAFWLATGAAADAIDRPDLGQLEAGARTSCTSTPGTWCSSPSGIRRTCSPISSGRAAAGTCATGSAAARWCATSPPPPWTPRRCGPTSPSGPPASPPADAECADPGPITVPAPGFRTTREPRNFLQPNG